MNDDYTIENLILTFEKHATEFEGMYPENKNNFNLAKALAVMADEIIKMKEWKDYEPF